MEWLKMSALELHQALLDHKVTYPNWSLRSAHAWRKPTPMCTP